MAKKKSSPIGQDEIWEDVETVTDTEEYEPELAPDDFIEMPDVETIELEDTSVEVTPSETVDNNINQFIQTQLKVLNKMENQAKARRLAERVLRNRKGL